MTPFVRIDDTRTFRFVSGLGELSEAGVRPVRLSGTDGLRAGAGKVGSPMFVASSNA